MKEWLLRPLSSYVITFSYLSIPIVSTLSIYHPPETLHYIHLFIQLDSFTICTLVYIIITIILFLHLHFTITFRQTTNSACAHQLRLAPQYDMHITSNESTKVQNPLRMEHSLMRAFTRYALHGYDMYVRTCTCT